MLNWYKSSLAQIPVCTRIRLARNITDMPFPSKMNSQQIETLNDTVIKALKSSNSPFVKNLKVIDMNALDRAEVISLVEKHLISPEFAEKRENKKLILSLDETISIMLCEEDHIRIQVLLSGMQLENAYKIANEIDDALSENLNIAFDENLGYLTQCPTNLGTGLRASLMLHLPLLELSGEINRVVDAVSKIGLTVRGMYGEGSKTKSSLYQLSNQITLGITENAAIENLQTIANQIITKENEMIGVFDELKLKDTIKRSLGILKYSQVMSSDEMMDHLSNILLGTRLNIIEEKLPIMKILISLQPAGINEENGNLSPQERDVIRAEKLREYFSEI